MKLFDKMIRGLASLKGIEHEIRVEESEKEAIKIDREFHQAEDSNHIICNGRFYPSQESSLDLQN